MPQPAKRFHADSVKEEWDNAADAWAQGQASGRDVYRLAFFGPAHVALCGDARGLRVLDVGCGSGYFSREMARRGARVTGIDISPRMLAHACRIESDTPFRRWQKDAAGDNQWLCIDRYFERGAVTCTWTDWPYAFATSACHATLEDWFAWIAQAGLTLRALREPVPAAEAVAAHPALEDATRIPFFLMFDAVRS